LCIETITYCGSPHPEFLKNADKHENRGVVETCEWGEISHRCGTGISRGT